MKRTFALLLAALLTMAAALPVLADDRVQSSAELTASSSSGTDGAETAVGTDAPPAASSGQTDAASPDASASGQTGDAAPAASVDVLIGSSVQNLQLNPKNSASGISFENLRGAMLNYNPTIQSLKAQIMDVNGMTQDSLWSAGGTLREMLSSTSEALGMVQNAMDDGSIDPSLIPVYRALSIALNANVISLQSAVAQNFSQVINVDNTISSTKNTLNNAIEKVISGAEQLYVGIIAMEDALPAVQRGLDALDRAVAIVEKQQELGMASAYDVESTRHQRAQVASQLEALKYQVTTNKLLLEGMCDMKLSGSVKLGALPVPTQAELDAVNYDKMLSTASAKNVDVANAEIAFGEDSGPVNKQARSAAQNSFASGFKGVCMAVPENVRLVSAAQETVDFQQRTFDIAAKKYELGMASHEEYLAAKSNLDSAQDDLNTAQRNLFSAYHAYESATKYGLV
ncbi:TolC family protein [uncultured Oscillibacter sp.]|uniref:TolC family protein n=1 Tax=uncultured Oscillibacter sp. TaxID=876091 RepID=UPI0025E58AC3|nr:TolC family protein [uncultured Oscillibacter sp.]